MNETRFKKTDIGEVPEDWDIDSLGNIINVLTDYTANGSFASLAENVTYLDHIDYARLVRLTDLRANFKNNGIYVSKSSYDFLKKSKLHGGEILLANVGAYAGYSFVYPKKMPFVGTLGPNMFLIKLDNNRIQDSYGIYIFIYGCVFDQLLSKATSSAQPKLNKDNVRECLFSCPKDKKEQQRIATVLSDIDVLLSTLNKKIEKKKLIKQGVMQQLLTGKKRLNGFTESWIEEKLGNISLIKTGCRNGNEAVENGKYPFFVRSQTVYRINSYSFDGEAIIIPVEGGIGSIYHYINGRFDYHQRVYKISDFPKNIYAKYIYFYMKQNFGDYATNLSVKATVDSLRLSAFSNFVLYMPPSKAEQIAIATILSDMDAEIEALETKRAKYEQVKQGMMQQLLTGKIRLID